MQREAASHVCRVYAFVGVADYAVIHAAFCCMAWPEQLAWWALFAQRFRAARVGILATANSKQAASASLRMAWSHAYICPSSQEAQTRIADKTAKAARTAYRKACASFACLHLGYSPDNRLRPGRRRSDRPCLRCADRDAGAGSTSAFAHASPIRPGRAIACTRQLHTFLPPGKTAFDCRVFHSLRAAEGRRCARCRTRAARGRASSSWTASCS